MRRLVLLLFVVSALAVAVVPSAVPATGHGCKINTTCKFFTSSYHTSKFFYKKCDTQWKSLSKTYLHGFKTKTALKKQFPSRKLHPSNC